MSDCNEKFQWDNRVNGKNPISFDLFLFEFLGIVSFKTTNSMDLMRSGPACVIVNMRFKGHLHFIRRYRRWCDSSANVTASAAPATCALAGRLWPSSTRWALTWRIATTAPCKCRRTLPERRWFLSKAPTSAPSTAWTVATSTRPDGSASPTTSSTWTRRPTTAATIR